MASVCLSTVILPSSTSKTLTIPPYATSSSPNITNRLSCRCSMASMPFLSPQQNQITFWYRHRRPQRHVVVGMAPDEEKLTRRNPLDFPIEWERPKPGRRPDIFPQFSPMKTPLPPPLPYDPPEEDEEEEEKKEEEEEDPENEDPDKQ